MSGLAKLALFLVPAAVVVSLAFVVALAQRSPSRLVRSTRSALAFWVTPVLAIAGVVGTSGRSWTWWLAAGGTALAAYGLHVLARLADDRALRHAARRLGVDYRPGDRVVEGSAHGATLKVRLQARVTTDSKGNKSTSHYTVVDAAGPRVPMLLDLRREGWWARFLVRRGYAVDLVTGAPWFDRRYLIEGAPRELILPILDDHMLRRIARQRLQSLRVDEGKVRLERWGWRWSTRQLDDLIDTAGIMVGRPPELLEAIERELGATHGGPFRAAVDASRARAAERARAQELDALHAARARRSQLYGRIGAAFGLAVFAAFAAMVLYAQCSGD